MRTFLSFGLLALLPTFGGCAVWKSLLSPNHEPSAQTTTAKQDGAGAGDGDGDGDTESESDSGPDEAMAAVPRAPAQCLEPGPVPASDLERRRGYVLVIACGEHLDQTAKRALTSTMPNIYAVQTKLDDRAFDQVELGLALTGCRTDWCRLDQGWKVSEGRLSAYLTYYDRRKLHQDLRKLRVTEAVANAFVAKVDARADELEHRKWRDKAAYVDVPLRVVLQRKAYLREHAARFASLDAAVENLDDGGGVVSKLEALRAEYLAQCDPQTCWADLFPMAVTRRLVEVHAGRDNRAAAHAERHRLLRGRPDAARPKRFWLAWEILTLPNHVNAAQKADVYISHKLLAYGVPGRPISLDLEAQWGKEAVKEVAHKVARVGASNNGWATIRFEDKVDTWEQAYACRRTNRVERIYADGEVEYEERCKYRTRNDRTKYDSIDLPAAEAELLEPGDTITAYQVVGERKAILALAIRGRRRVVWRTHQSR